MNINDRVDKAVRDFIGDGKVIPKCKSLQEITGVHYQTTYLFIRNNTMSKKVRGKFIAYLEMHGWVFEHVDLQSKKPGVKAVKNTAKARVRKDTQKLDGRSKNKEFQTAKSKATGASVSLSDYENLKGRLRDTDSKLKNANTELDRLNIWVSNAKSLIENLKLERDLAYRSGYQKGASHNNTSHNNSIFPNTDRIKSLISLATNNSNQHEANNARMAAARIIANSLQSYGININLKA